MDYQTMFNWAVAIVGALGGWIMRTMWDEIKSLQKNDREITDKISGVEVLVAGQYVKRDDMDRITAALFAKLDRIEDKIDKKADKQ